MATDNNQDNDRIDRLEAIMQMVAETQRQLVESAQRHDMEMEMLRAIQRDQAATQQDQAAAIERHDMRMEMLQATQDQVVNLVQIMSTMLRSVIDTQQEHGNAIRNLEEGRDNAP